jgi:hypothetical protein
MRCYAIFIFRRIILKRLEFGFIWLNTEIVAGSYGHCNVPSAFTNGGGFFI